MHMQVHSTCTCTCIMKVQGNAHAYTYTKKPEMNKQQKSRTQGAQHIYNVHCIYMYSIFFHGVYMYMYMYFRKRSIILLLLHVCFVEFNFMNVSNISTGGGANFAKCYDPSKFRKIYMYTPLTIR